MWVLLVYAGVNVSLHACLLGCVCVCMYVCVCVCVYHAHIYGIYAYMFVYAWTSRCLRQGNLPRMQTSDYVLHVSKKKTTEQIIQMVM